MKSDIIFYDPPEVEAQTLVARAIDSASDVSKSSFGDLVERVEKQTKAIEAQTEAIKKYVEAISYQSMASEKAVDSNNQVLDKLAELIKVMCDRPEPQARDDSVYAEAVNKQTDAIDKLGESIRQKEPMPARKATVRNKDGVYAEITIENQ